MSVKVKKTDMKIWPTNFIEKKKKYMALRKFEFEITAVEG